MSKFFWETFFPPLLPIIRIEQQQQQQQQADSQEIKAAKRVFKHRRKLFDRKYQEFVAFDLNTKELFYKQMSVLGQHPELLAQWQRQWYTLNKKNFKKFKWFII